MNSCVYGVSVVDKPPHPDHKWLDYLQHLWPYVAAFFATSVTAFRLWWNDRKLLRSRINNVEIIAQNCVTQEQLHECRNEVRDDDTKNLDLIFSEIKELRRERKRDAETTAQRLLDIQSSMLALHQGDRT